MVLRSSPELRPRDHDGQRSEQARRLIVAREKCQKDVHGHTHVMTVVSAATNAAVWLNPESSARTSIVSS